MSQMPHEQLLAKFPPRNWRGQMTWSEREAAARKSDQVFRSIMGRDAHRPHRGKRVRQQRPTNIVPLRRRKAS